MKNYIVYICLKKDKYNQQKMDLFKINFAIKKTITLSSQM